MKKIVLVVLLTLCSIASAEFHTGQVTGYIPSDFAGKELVMVKMDGDSSGGLNVSGRFAIDGSQLRFKGIRASLMAAFYGKTPVTIAYRTTCNIFPNAWDIDYVCINNVPC